MNVALLRNDELKSRRPATFSLQYIYDDFNYWTFVTSSE